VRFERDVLSQSGVRFVVLAPYLPDIQYSNRPVNPWRRVSVDDLARVFEAIVEQSHRRGIKVIGSTIMPFSLTNNAEVERLTVNTWIRTSGVFDALIDLDKITGDPAHPENMQQVYAAGGVQTILADQIDLSIFTPLPQR
jgi:hypothetical protein